MRERCPLSVEIDSRKLVTVHEVSGQSLHANTKQMSNERDTGFRHYVGLFKQDDVLLKQFPLSRIGLLSKRKMPTKRSDVGRNSRQILRVDPLFCRFSTTGRGVSRGEQPYLTN